MERRIQSDLEFVDERLGGDGLLVALAEVEAAVVQRQVIVGLLHLATALAQAARPRLPRSAPPSPPTTAPASPSAAAARAESRPRIQTRSCLSNRRLAHLQYLYIGAVVVVHAPNRRLLHRRQRVVAQLQRTCGSRSVTPVRDSPAALRRSVWFRESRRLRSDRPRSGRERPRTGCDACAVFHHRIQASR